MDSGYARSKYKFRDARVTISQADWRLMAWLKSNFGGCISKTHSTNRQCWSWLVGSRAATEIMTRIRPYLIVKGEQADIALAYRATMTPGRKPIAIEVVKLRDELKQQLQHIKRNPPNQEQVQ